MSSLSQYVTPNEGQEALCVVIWLNSRYFLGTLTKEPFLGEGFLPLVQVPLLEVIDDRDVVDPGTA